MANSQQQARTRAAGSGSILYTRAILEHPDESWTPPSSKPQPLLQHRSPDGDCITHAAGHEDWSIMEGPGELFVDGSCTTHPVAECRRAAWAVVRVLDDGTPAAWCRGAVPSDLPQSAQAAEYFAAGVSGQVAAKDTVIRSDCLNVVKNFNADAVKQLSRRRRYAGVVRSARSYEGFNALQNLRKVEAHVSVSSCITEFEKFCAKGNGAVDEQAKLGLGSHPGQSLQVLLQWDREWADATTTAKLIAAVGPMWPAVRPPDGRRLPCPERRTGDRAERTAARTLKEQAAQATHTWIQIRRRQYCTACGAFSARSGPGAAPCPGKSAYLAQLVADPRGHHILVGDIARPQVAKPTALLICQSCGAWSDTGVSRALLQGCAGRPPSKHARDAVRRAREGKYPKPGGQYAGFRVVALQPLDHVCAAQGSGSDDDGPGASA